MWSLKTFFSSSKIEFGSGWPPPQVWQITRLFRFFFVKPSLILRILFFSWEVIFLVIGDFRCDFLWFFFGWDWGTPAILRQNRNKITVFYGFCFCFKKLGLGQTPLSPRAEGDHLFWANHWNFVIFLLPCWLLTMLMSTKQTLRLCRL